MSVSAGTRTGGSTQLAVLSGRPGGGDPRLPTGLLAGLRRLAGSIAEDSGAVGDRVVVDPVETLCARAAASGLTRRGDVSCGGACHLMPTADGWLAVSLPRPEDWETTAAWLGLAAPVARGAWHEVATEVSSRRGHELTERAVLLGMAVAVVGERARRGPAPCDGGGSIPGVTVRDAGAWPEAGTGRRLTVVDLSALWAGPLAASLLGRAGARVVKVESTVRPDGARRGPPSFFRSLNGRKEAVALDFASGDGRRALGDLVAGADVVVSSARPRALEQLGLVPEAMVRSGGPGVWLAVTGYGDGPGSSGRVAFGDDAAAAGGLVVWDDEGPCFCGDAVADPATGLAAAAAVLRVLRTGRRAVVVASMADVAAGLT